MAAPTYFHSASSPADNSAQADNGTRTVTPPASCLKNDLVVIVAAMGIAAPTAPTISQASGQSWTSATGSGGNAVYFRVFWCSFNGTWGADPSVTFANESGTVACSVIMHVFRPDSAGGWAIDTAYAGGTEASASPVVITGITPNNDDNVVLAGWLIQSTTGKTWGTLSGANWTVVETAQYRNTSGTDISAAFAYQLQGTKGATGDVSLVPSSATAGYSFTMAWRHIIGKTANIGDDVDLDGFTDVTSGLSKQRALASDDASLGLAEGFSANKVDLAGTVYDTVTWKVLGVAVASDAVTIDDSGLTARLVYLPQMADSSVATDDISALSKHRADLSDAVTQSDSVTALNRYLATLSPESVSQSDDVLGLVRQLAVLSEDFSASLSDLVLKNLIDLGGATPINAPFGDDAGLTFSDSATSLQRLLAISSEVLTYSDLLAALHRHLASIGDDSATLVEGLSALQRYLATSSDSSIPTDDVAALERFRASFTESFSPTDTATSLVPFLAAVSEALGLTDLTAALNRYRATLGEDYSANAIDATTSLMRHRATLTDAVSLIDDVIKNLIIVGIADPINVSVSDSLSLSDSLAALQTFLAQSSESLTVSDVAASIQRCLGEASDSAATADDTLQAIQRALAAASEAFSADDSLSASLALLGQLQAILATMSDSLELSDETQALLRSLGPTFGFNKYRSTLPGIVYPETAVRRILAGSKRVLGRADTVIPKGVND